MLRLSIKGVLNGQDTTTSAAVASETAAPVAAAGDSAEEERSRSGSSSRDEVRLAPAAPSMIQHPNVEPHLRLITYSSLRTRTTTRRRRRRNLRAVGG